MHIKLFTNDVFHCPLQVTVAATVCLLLSVPVWFFPLEPTTPWWRKWVCPSRREMERINILLPLPDYCHYFCLFEGQKCSQRSWCPRAFLFSISVSTSGFLIVCPAQPVTRIDWKRIKCFFDWFSSLPDMEEFLLRAPSCQVAFLTVVTREQREQWEETRISCTRYFNWWVSALFDSHSRWFQM